MRATRAAISVGFIVTIVGCILAIPVVWRFSKFLYDFAKIGVLLADYGNPAMSFLVDPPVLCVSIILAAYMLFVLADTKPGERWLKELFRSMPPSEDPPEAVAEKLSTWWKWINLCLLCLLLPSFFFSNGSSSSRLTPPIPTPPPAGNLAPVLSSDAAEELTAIEEAFAVVTEEWHGLAVKSHKYARYWKDGIKSDNNKDLFRVLKEHRNEWASLMSRATYIRRKYGDHDALMVILRRANPQPTIEAVDYFLDEMHKFVEAGYTHSGGRLPEGLTRASESYFRAYERSIADCAAVELDLLARRRSLLTSRSN